MGRAQRVAEWLKGTWGPGEALPEGLVELCDIPKYHRILVPRGLSREGQVKTNFDLSPRLVAWQCPSKNPEESELLRVEKASQSMESKL